MNDEIDLNFVYSDLVEVKLTPEEEYIIMVLDAIANGVENE